MCLITTLVYHSVLTWG